MYDDDIFTCVCVCVHQYSMCVYVCVCVFGEGEVCVLTWLAECLLFNLSSVKLTYLTPLTTDVWLAQPAP